THSQLPVFSTDNSFGDRGLHSEWVTQGKYFLPHMKHIGISKFAERQILRFDFEESQVGFGVVPDHVSREGFFIPKDHFYVFSVLYDMVIGAYKTILRNDHSGSVLVDFVGIKLPKPLLPTRFDFHQGFESCFKNIADHILRIYR